MENRCGVMSKIGNESTFSFIDQSFWPNGFCQVRTWLGRGYLQGLVRNGYDDSDRGFCFAFLISLSLPGEGEDSSFELKVSQSLVCQGG